MSERLQHVGPLLQALHQPLGAAEGDHRAVVGAQVQRRIEHPPADLGHGLRPAAGAGAGWRRRRRPPPAMKVGAVRQAAMALAASTSVTASWNSAARSALPAPVSSFCTSGSQHRRLQAGKAEIQVAAVQHRPRQLEAARRTRLGQLGQRRPAGVAEAEQLGGLVEGLAGRVVERLAEQFVLADAVATRINCVWPPETSRATNGKAADRPTAGARAGGLRDDAPAAPAPRAPCQRLGEAGADQQGAGQARSGRVGDGVDVPAAAPASASTALQQRNQAPDVVARGQFGHHAAVGLVHRDLRMHGMASRPRSVS
jgi:hypothetical protein